MKTKQKTNSKDKQSEITIDELSFIMFEAVGKILQKKKLLKWLEWRTKKKCKFSIERKATEVWINACLELAFELIKTHPEAKDSMLKLIVYTQNQIKILEKNNAEKK